MTLQILGMTLMDGSPSAAQDQPAAAPAAARADDNGGITLPPGFCATVVADNVGHARHLVVAPNGVVYVNTWSGRYYGNDTPPPGGFLVALQDHDGDGQADTTVRFGGTLAQGAHGGTGIALYDGGLYAEANDRIVRYELPDDAIAPTGSPKTIVSGLPLTGDHPMHPFAIDARGGLYVNSGSATNACQVENRMPQSPGHRPCTELATRAGIWRYDANRTGQRFSATERFATGIRNAGGIAVDPNGLGIYATQHGRDQLAENWPSLYQPEQGANLPAEELLRVERGADYGWPECYFDDTRHRLVLAPEYGGDGGEAVGPCARKGGPVAVFPAHWAPNDLLLYRCQLWMPRALLSRSESPELGLQRPAYGEYRVRNSHGRIEPEAAWVSLHTAHVDTDIRPVGVWDIDRDARTRVEDPRIARLIYDPDDISRQRQVPAPEHGRARYREPLSRVRKGEPYVS